MLKEPITSITDFILFLESILFSILLYIRANNNIHFNSWSGVFLFLAIGSLLGAIAHGFKLSPFWDNFVWKSTMITLGITLTLFGITALIDNRNPVVLKYGYISLIIVLIVYISIVMKVDKFYIFLIIAFVNLSIALIVYGNLIGSNIGSKWIFIGLIISIIGNIVQASKIKIFLPFNHNDVFHIIQMFALICIYYGVVQWI